MSKDGMLYFFTSNTILEDATHHLGSSFVKVVCWQFSLSLIYPHVTWHKQAHLIVVRPETDCCTRRQHPLRSLEHIFKCRSARGGQAQLVSGSLRKPDRQTDRRSSLPAEIFSQASRLWQLERTVVTYSYVCSHSASPQVTVAAQTLD